MVGGTPSWVRHCLKIYSFIHLMNIFMEGGTRHLGSTLLEDLFIYPSHEYIHGGRKTVMDQTLFEDLLIYPSHEYIRGGRNTASWIRHCLKIYSFIHLMSIFMEGGTPSWIRHCLKIYSFLKIY